MTHTHTHNARRDEDVDAAWRGKGVKELEG